MENARGARAAREARSIPELDARVAAVAVHLGMVEDAKRMYISAERFDLLNRLYRASGQWEKALEVAEKNDRIHLKSTHYAFAQVQGYGSHSVICAVEAKSSTGGCHASVRLISTHYAFAQV